MDLDTHANESNVWLQMLRNISEKRTELACYISSLSFDMFLAIRPPHSTSGTEDVHGSVLSWLEAAAPFLVSLKELR